MSEGLHGAQRDTLAHNDTTCTLNTQSVASVIHEQQGKLQLHMETHPSEVTGVRRDHVLFAGRWTECLNVKLYTINQRF